MMASKANSQYCLRWNNHQNNLLCNFSRLLGSDSFTDVLLAAEGRTLRAHKVVLSACSSYFESLFVTFADQAKQIVILKDTPYDDAAAIVEFMYKGEVNIAQSQLQSLLRTAESLKVKGLAEVEASPMPSVPSSGPGLDGRRSPEQDAPLSLTRNNANKSLKVLSQDLKCKTGTSLSIPSGSGEVKRKRGRPRILDSPGENPDPCFTTGSSSTTTTVTSGNSGLGNSRHNIPKVPKLVTGDHHSMYTQASTSSGEDLHASPMENSLSGPTPGGPLTPERIDSLGIVKMGDYLSSGTRQQFWEEYYVKVIMQAVRNKEVDMKGAAELLGVSYGTLYGRYRETFGYLKHSWNLSGRSNPAANSSAASSSSTATTTVSSSGSSSSSLHHHNLAAAAAATVNPLKIEPSMLLAGGGLIPPFPELTTEQETVFEQLRIGRITVKQAGALLGIDPSMLAFQLTARIHHTEFMDDSMEDPIPGPRQSAVGENSNSGTSDNEQETTVEVKPDIIDDDDANSEPATSSVKTSKNGNSSVLGLKVYEA